MNHGNKVLEAHIALVLFVDFSMANPQGDPDRDNAPRTDDATGHGLITPMGPKRKIRDNLAKMGNTIYVSRGACFETQNKPIFESVGVDAPPPVEGDEDGDEEEEAPAVAAKGAKGKKPKKAKVPADKAVKIYQTINAKYLDSRLFGQLVPRIPGTCRGPIQFSWGRSVDKVTPLRASITRVAVATEAESLDQKGANRTMGGTWYLPYGLYRFHIYVNPSDARVTSCTEEDYQKFIQATITMFDFDRSSVRTSSCVRALYEFRLKDYDKMSGPVNTERLLESVRVTRKSDVETARSFEDYTITVPAKVQNHPDFTFKRLVSEVNPFADDVEEKEEKEAAE